MDRNPAACGHFGLVFGLLGIIVMLGFVNFAVDPGGYGMSAVFLPVILWLVGVMIVAMEFLQPGDSAKSLREMVSPRTEGHRRLTSSAS